jgi:hypothetical protein
VDFLFMNPPLYHHSRPCYNKKVKNKALFFILQHE